MTSLDQHLIKEIARCRREIRQCQDEIKLLEKILIKVRRQRKPSEASDDRDQQR